MGNSALLDDYKGHYDRAATVSQQNDAVEVAFFAGLVAPAPPVLRILDIGCAEGALAVALARRGHRVWAADISPRFLERTRERAAAEAVSLATVELDIERGGVGTEQFDVVFMMDIVEHLRAPSVALTHVRQMLTQTGYLYIHTPNCCALSRFLHYLLHPHRRFDYFRPENLGDLHLVLFDQMSLEKMLNLVGFRVVRVIPTVLTPPVVNRFGRWPRLSRLLARKFPHLADTLLFECQPCEPVDISSAVAWWERQLAGGLTPRPR